MFRIISIFAAMLLSTNSFAASTAQELFSTINLRLSYMEDVALYKSNNNQAIEDKERELIVINNASLSAEKQGLNKESVLAFFRAQISAAKAIQYRYRADLLSKPTDKEPRNLDTVIRPALIKLGKDINIELTQYLRHGGVFSQQEFKVFERTLNSRYLTRADKEMLFNALIEIRLQ
ncbi:gamma subclass chorismate mutase AroQ [Pseudoalteromonas sp. SR44-5]|uniref:gamma subclass chorismate mutase AroQ n=1 Tax=Pseudoalteromonas TaxID=53246 RepID=UPI0012311F8B|nr:MULTISPECIES: gamma subclass chorismate mutase AroQ [Pseudoalteromonas]MBB1332427.1 gamma subclass chorismate mutase AroQ [Pseudoalteromonas sp. SR41-6]MBB1342453.1 gamma subclass chorismate mutase AroQ [Pseudoalteromonas sp. SR45-6]MBB1368020.1 gamma subclass chorismate mutase AroQ [Pseudoalteromonas sp. SR44-5]MBB1415889.1 gamma subclass chorismate mutase AroQ [Pseudoalteromonas sp. SG44-1]MBB1423474.1 gamma subclass chorismate mutase AroQ [Pseudoalteromonas sp. SG43-7]